MLLHYPRDQLVMPLVFLLWLFVGESVQALLFPKLGVGCSKARLTARSRL